MKDWSDEDELLQFAQRQCSTGESVVAVINIFGPPNQDLVGIQAQELSPRKGNVVVVSVDRYLQWVFGPLMLDALFSDGKLLYFRAGTFTIKK